MFPDDEDDGNKPAHEQIMDLVIWIGTAALIGLLIAVAVGCGPVIPTPIQVAPIEVIHRLGLDPAKLQAYFEGQCEGAGSPDACVDEKLTEFYAAMAAGSVE